VAFQAAVNLEFRYGRIGPADLVAQPRDTGQADGSRRPGPGGEVIEPEYSPLESSVMVL
jgi:hypothetical protein